MSAVKDLASAVQQCFAIYSLPADLHRHDVMFIGEIGSQLQPVLLHLQKAALQCSEEEVAADMQLSAATAAVHASLQTLQEAAGRCRIRHWLLRVLSARDVRLQLAAALSSMAAAMQDLSTAAESSVIAEDLSSSQLSALRQLQRSVASHKATRHEPLEALARGLLKHVMDDRTDQEQLPSMLKYVVKQAALQTYTAPAAGNAAAGISSGAGSSSAAGSSVGAGSSRAAAEGAGSSNSSGSSSKANRDQLPAGESSLTDTELLMVLEQLAAAKASEEQLALYQILSILEGLQEAKRQQQREHHKKRAQHRQQQQQQPLQRVSEADDDLHSIAAVRDPAAASSTHPAAPAASAATPNSQAGGGDQPAVGVGEVVSAMMGQLEEMLWRDPWDAAALMQLLELLLQVEPEEAQQGVEDQDSSEATGSSADSGSSSAAGLQQGRDSKQQRDQSSKQAGKKGKWWQVSAAAKAALQSRLTGSTKSSTAGSKAQKPQAASAEQQARRAAWRERVRMLAAGAIDVLLHLTPRPCGSDSFLQPSSKGGVCTEVGHSLVFPLMAHADTVPALAACLWSGWPEVASRATQLLTILLQSGSAVAAAGCATGVADGATSTYAKFCQQLCSSGGTGVSSIGQDSSSQHGRSIWSGFVQLLHSSTPTVAGAAAEALAAVGSSRTMLEICSSLAATQQARALLLLLARHKVHPGAGGAAAAALFALSDPSMRPGMHNILAGSYWDEVPGAAVSLSSVLLQMMEGVDSLAAARAAQLAASLAGDVYWEHRTEAWLQSFKAAMKLLAARTSSSSSTAGSSNTGNTAAAPGAHSSTSRNISSSKVRASGAVLLVQLIGCWQGAAGGRTAMQEAQQQHKVSPMLAAHVEVAEQEELLFEALQLCVQQFSNSGSWEGLDDLQFAGSTTSSGGGIAQLAGNEAAAAVQLLGALLRWLPVEARCAVPDMHAALCPVLEHLAATQQGWLQWEARRTHELLLGVAG